jgi:hypothetical protein
MSLTWPSKCRRACPAFRSRSIGTDAASAFAVRPARAGPVRSVAVIGWPRKRPSARPVRPAARGAAGAAAPEAALAAARAATGIELSSSDSRASKASCIGWSFNRTCPWRTARRPKRSPSKAEREALASSGRAGPNCQLERPSGRRSSFRSSRSATSDSMRSGSPRRAAKRSRQRSCSLASDACSIGWRSVHAGLAMRRPLVSKRTGPIKRRWKRRPPGPSSNATLRSRRWLSQRCAGPSRKGQPRHSQAATAAISNSSDTGSAKSHRRPRRRVPVEGRAATDEPWASGVMPACILRRVQTRLSGCAARRQWRGKPASRSRAAQVSA